MDSASYLLATASHQEVVDSVWDQGGGETGEPEPAQQDYIVYDTTECMIIQSVWSKVLLCVHYCTMYSITVCTLLQCVQHYISVYIITV